MSFSHRPMWQIYLIQSCWLKIDCVGEWLLFNTKWTTSISWRQQVTFQWYFDYCERTFICWYQFS